MFRGANENTKVVKKAPKIRGSYYRKNYERGLPIFFGLSLRDGWTVIFGALLSCSWKAFS